MNALKRSEILIFLLVVVVLIFISMEWSNKNGGTISAGIYQVFGSQATTFFLAVSMPSGPSLYHRVIFFPWRTQPREYQDGNFCFQLMNTALSLWSDNVQCCAFTSSTKFFYQNEDFTCNAVTALRKLPCL